MFHTCCVLIKLSLIVCVLGVINVDNSNKTETERKLADLEANIVQKLNKLESNTLDRIITYIDHKLDALNKKGEENLMNITQTFNALNKKIEENIFNTTQTFNELNKTVEENFEMKISQAMNESNKKVEQNLLNITQKLNALNKKVDENIFNTTHTVEENFEQKITEAINTSNKKGEENLLNITQTFNKKIEENFLNTTQTFNELNKKTEDNLEEKIAQTSNALDSMKKEVQEIRKSQLPCKEVSVSSHRYSPHFSMDNETLNHVTVQRDSAGRLTCFELHVTIQADTWVEILLRDKNHSLICDIEVGQDNNQYTDLYLWNPVKRVQRTHTPDILSSTQFRTFYIKVDDGTVQFGKRGDSTPLVSYYDDRFRLVDYFSFWNSGSNTKIRFDCPHVPESL